MVTLKHIRVEVAYAGLDNQQVVCVSVPEGATLEKAIDCSGILDLFPEIDLTQQKVGVFSKQKKLTETVYEGDRIEIYRPLIFDPKEARRRRASS